MLRALSLCLLLSTVLGWTITSPTTLRPWAHQRTAQHALMMAKSKKPNRKSKRKGTSASKPVYEPATSASFTESPSGLPVVDTSARSEPAAPVEDRVAQVLRGAGLSSDTNNALGAGTTPQNADPLSRIPKKGQELLERFFAGGAVTFGSVFIISGIGVSVEALCKVLGYPLPVFLDEALVQYVEPVLTPSVLILFGFSISLGVLKQLQLGSESAGVLYLEDDD